LAPKPDRVTIFRELAQTKLALAGKSDRQLLELPEIVNPAQMAKLRILDLVQAPAFFCSQELMAVLSMVGIRLTLRDGNTPWAASFYATYCIILSGLGELQQTYRLGQLATILADRYAYLSISARVKVAVAVYSKPWQEPLRATISLLDESVRMAVDSGNLQYIGINAGVSTATRFYAGMPLDKVVDLIPKTSELIALSKDENSQQFFDLTIQTIENLHVATDRPTDIFKGKDELLLVAQWQAKNEAILLSTMYGFQTLLAYHFEDIPQALSYADAQLPYEYSAKGGYSIARIWLFDALTRLAAYPHSGKRIQTQLLKRIEAAHRELGKRARLMPENFQHQYDLVAAEKCQIWGDVTGAIELYDRAISGADANEYLQEAALAKELAAKFYLKWGKPKIAATYMQEAYYGYLRWGATAKTADLERRYPQLLVPILHSKQRESNALATLVMLTNSAIDDLRGSQSGTNLDLAAIIQSAQSLSSKIELEELIGQLSQIILTNSGAQTCILALPDRQDEWQIRSISTVAAEKIATISLRPTLVDTDEFPTNLIYWVKNTQATVVLDARQPLAIPDRYLLAHQPQSVLCLPIVHQDRVLGVLYLEHRQAPAIFTAPKQTVISFLCTQAAIALHNAQLYEAVGQRSAAIEASLDGFAILDRDRFIYLNQSHADMFGYTIAELLDRDWHCLYSMLQLQEFATTAFPALAKLGQWQGEAIATRKDGSTFNEEVTLFSLDNGQIICICRNITERKSMEMALRESEERYHQLVSNIPGALYQFELTADGTRQLNYVSARFYEIFEAAPDLLVGDIAVLLSQIVPVDRRSFDRSIRKATKLGTSWAWEGRISTPSGKIKWIRGESRYQQTGDDKIVWDGILTDITDRKQTEIALRQSEVRYQKLADNIPGIIYQFRLAPDGSRSYPYVSSGCWELLQLTPAAVMADAQCAIDLIHPDDRPALKQVMAISAQELTPIQWKGRMLLHSGAIKWIKYAARPELQADGAIVWDGVMLDITAQQAALQERDRAEIALRQSEARYQKLADNIPGVIYQFRLAPDGSMSYPFVSSGCWDLFQVTATAIMNEAHCAIELFHHDDCLQLQQVLMASARDLTPLLCEGRIILPTGEIKWIKYAARPELQADGAIVWDGVMLDITAQKAAQQERDRQAAALRAIVEWTALGKSGLEFYQACTSYIVANFDVQYAFLSQPTLDRPTERAQISVMWTGTEFLQPDEINLANNPCGVTYQHDWGIFPSDLRSHFPQSTLLASLQGESYLSVTIRDGEGTILGNLGIIDTKPLPADLTALQFILQLFADRIAGEIQRQADESELRKRQQQIEAFINNSPAAMYLKDLEGRYQLINQTCLNLVGGDRLYVGETDYALHPPAIASQIDARDRELIRTGESISIEEVALDLHGVERTYISNKFVLTDEDGQPYALGGVSTDITDRKQAEARLELTNQELQRATRLKDEFLATMSHELRTPLNAILGMSESLQDEDVFGTLNPAQLQAIVTIEHSGEHLLSLINDILDVSKISAGQLKLNLDRVSWRELCQSSLSLVSPQAISKQIQIDTQFAIAPDWILVDERRMRQVLINLLNNAVKFTPSGGQVKLSVSIDAAGWCLAVSDTGIGIDRADLAKLFQPFVQIDSSLNRKYQGTGLGLVLVKQIVELHGGTVTISSQVGKGSCFSVLLPQTCGQFESNQIANDSLAVVADDRIAAPRPVTVLLAEGNEVIIDTFSNYLTAKGCRVILAPTGTALMSLMASYTTLDRRFRPDVIAIDLQLLATDGRLAIDALCQHPLQIPIIAITQSFSSDDRARCGQLGATYLIKPVKLLELYQAILNCLKIVDS
jgi:PAS domain S-box-containing protein